LRYCLEYEGHQEQADALLQVYSAYFIDEIEDSAREKIKDDYELKYGDCGL